MIKPLLKWAGGKTQLLDNIINILPGHINNYYEPFLGGGALFFNLSYYNLIKGRVFLNDFNFELINFYTVVRDNPDKLIENLDKFIQLGLTEESYYKIRSLNYYDLDIYKAAARTLYLNKCGFNGLFRLNKKGIFNVPWGKRNKVKFYDKDNLELCSKYLKNAELSCTDFSIQAHGAKKGDLVYIDPPYVPLNPTSNFKNYTADGFCIEDHKRLADWCINLVSRGVFVIISNSDTSIVRELYCDFDINVVKARRNINSKSDKRGKINELLIIGK